MSVELSLEAINGAIRQGELAEAKNLIESAVIDYPDNAQVHFLAAAICAQSEDYDNAISHYETCLQLRPNYEIASFQCGLLLITLEQTEAGIRHLSAIRESDDSYLSAFARGVMLIIAGQLDAAIRMIALGLQLNKENTSLNRDMQEMLARVEHAGQNDVGAQEMAAGDATETPEPEADETETEANDTSHLLDVYKTH